MLRLSPGGSRLGRSADNTIQLPDASISRYHAFLGADDEGQVRLTDLGSTNGTFLNGRRLPENTPVRVQDGDRLQFGATVIVKFIRPDPCEEQFQREMFERTVRDPSPACTTGPTSSPSSAPWPTVGPCEGWGRPS